MPTPATIPISLSDPSGLAPEDNPGYCVGWRGDCDIDPVAGNDVHGEYSPEQLSRKGVRKGQIAAIRKSWISHHSPMENDSYHLTYKFESYFSNAGEGYWDVGKWKNLDGTTGQACFGKQACWEAWMHLLENPDDVEGAKVIAATYCLVNKDECVSKAKDSEKWGALADIAGGLMMLAGGAGAKAGEDETGCNSFTAATPVLLADGSSKPIGRVKVGDQVKNARPDSDITQQHEVTALHVTDSDHDFVDVSIEASAGTKVITATAHHRFWDATTHAWTDATDLRVGDLLSTPGNGHAAIKALSRYAATVRTYNLTIGNLHTYYVLAGSTPVLVHNSGCGSSTYYHGSDVPSLLDVLNNGLDASKAAGSYTDGPGGFFVATHVSDAEFFAVRHGPGAVIKVQISDGAMTQLRDAGAVQRSIPTGPNSPTFAGEEFHIPTSAFELFNRLRTDGEIRVSP